MESGGGAGFIDWIGTLQAPLYPSVSIDPEIFSLLVDGYLCKLSAAAAAGIDVTVQAKR